jgi:hypothetical protein
MDRAVLITLKSIVLFFSAAAFVISLILVFSKDLFIKISRSLSNDLSSSTGGVYFEKSYDTEKILSQNISTLGFLTMLLSIISLYYIGKSFDVAVLTGIFSSNKNLEPVVEVCLKTMKYLFLVSLSLALILSVPMIFLPDLFRRINDFFRRQYHIGVKETAPAKVYSIDEMIIKLHIPIGIVTTLLSAYIFFIGLTRF